MKTESEQIVGIFECMHMCVCVCVCVYIYIYMCVFCYVYLRCVGAMEQEYAKRRGPQAHHDKLLFLF